MSEPIHEDDAKFNELFIKQHSTMDSLNELLPQPENNIEGDDMKMDDLLLLQTVSEDVPQHNSIEEKYEEELLVNEVAKQFSEGKEVKVDEDINGNVIFWIEGDPEDLMEDDVPFDFDDIFDEE